jgi:amidohydrolase
MKASTPLLKEIEATLNLLKTEIRDWRRYLHKHPEPSGSEFQTTSFIIQILEERGINFRIGPDGRGVIIDSDNDTESPRIALRADIDALRLQDEKTVTYHSQEMNLMHACGHDAHTAMLLGAVISLHKNKAHEHGVHWRAIFQPAEETAQGALEMIRAGAIQNIHSIIALHVDPYYPVGTMAYRKGALTANCIEIAVRITGDGGHGARPHQAHDPLWAASEFLQKCYNGVPRICDARDPSIISFGVMQSGINPNVIPEHAQLRGTLRTVSNETSRKIQSWLLSLADTISQLHQVEIAVEFPSILGGVINDPSLTGSCIRAAKKILPEKKVIPIKQVSMGGEDFANYLNNIPGCMLRLGCGTPGIEPHPLHSPYFDIDERALIIGASYLAQAAIQIAQDNS